MYYFEAFITILGIDSQLESLNYIIIRRLRGGEVRCEIGPRSA